MRLRKNKLILLLVLIIALIPPIWDLSIGAFPKINIIINFLVIIYGAIVIYFFFDPMLSFDIDYRPKITNIYFKRAVVSIILILSAYLTVKILWLVLREIILKDSSRIGVLLVYLTNNVFFTVTLAPLLALVGVILADWWTIKSQNKKS